ncbi:MAG: 2-octaprenyl-6-methoxyphenyl hydroxylase [Rickettsiales bacterium]|nr:MAG: 2-octaprenyl-6-methoxyphenyl hydroxylase [Rickettsiales bacterium]
MLTIDNETTIVGGGIIGLSIACILAKSGISISLVHLNKNTPTDGRSSALSHRSKLLYEKYGIWQFIEKYANPIDSIKIIDDSSDSIVNFPGHIVGNTLGYMINNNVLTDNLYYILKSYDNVSFIDGHYSNIYNDMYRAQISTDNNKINSNLIIAADGKYSSVRRSKNIDCENHDFKQTAIVCNVIHDKNHNNIAYEKFFTTGPFAILPLIGGYSSSIVWVEASKVAKLYLNMSGDEFLYYLSKRFGNFLGDIKIISPIFSYALSSSHISRYFDNRIAFVGDAAHSIHPLAGQGLNIGLIDVEILSYLINDFYRAYEPIAVSSLDCQYHTFCAHPLSARPPQSHSLPFA